MANKIFEANLVLSLCLEAERLANFFLGLGLLIVNCQSNTFINMIYKTSFWK
jgi:hypothetical protein